MKTSFDTVIVPEEVPIYECAILKYAEKKCRITKITTKILLFSTLFTTNISFSLSDSLALCQCCGRYFIPETKHKTLYCDRIIRKGKTCKQIAPALKHKRDATQNSVIEAFDRTKKKCTNGLSVYIILLIHWRTDSHLHNITVGWAKLNKRAITILPTKYRLKRHLVLLQQNKKQAAGKTNFKLILFAVCFDM